MIDARRHPRFVQRLIRDLRPSLAHPEDLIPARTQAALMPIRSREVEGGPGTQTVGAYLPSGHEKVGVMMAVVGMRTRFVDR
jgi:hypothetical protein